MITFWHNMIHRNDVHEIQAYSGLDPGTVNGSTCIYTEHIEIHSFTQLGHTCYVYIKSRM